MHFAVVTLFPEMFSALTDYGISGRALRDGRVSVACLNPRDFTSDRHRTVDDRPYGGGPGMLMKTEPLVAAIGAARQTGTASKDKPSRTIYLSPQGRPLDQPRVESLAREPGLILVCGRYQGIDARVIEAEIDEELSIGDYVLSGGELGAMVLMDALIRLQPGALGDADSAQEDSFSDGLLHSPEYTRPEQHAGQRVPPVLLSGDHGAIRRWRRQQSLGVTWVKRPDLLRDRELSREDEQLLQDYIRDYEQAGEAE